MKIIVNGTEHECVENQTMEQFLASKGYQTNHIAVELNGDILPKSEYTGYVLAPNDKLEVVSFVGGG